MKDMIPREIVELYGLSVSTDGVCFGTTIAVVCDGADKGKALIRAPYSQRGEQLLIKWMFANSDWQIPRADFSGTDEVPEERKYAEGWYDIATQYGTARTGCRLQISVADGKKARRQLEDKIRKDATYMLRLL